VNILIANVGNIRSNEVKVLAEALNKNHKINIATMATESTSCGLAFSGPEEAIRVSPLLYKEIVANTAWVAHGDISSVKAQSKTKMAGFDGIAAVEFFSTPADAVSIMLCDVMAHQKPDVVLCGINNGTHMGQDIYSSSSIGMAMEASFLGIPAIAVGIEHQPGGHSEKSLENAVTFIEKNITTLAKLRLPKGTVLNINIPTVDKYKKLNGVKITRMGRMTQFSEYEEKTDSKGKKYYWAKNVERLNGQPDEEWARTWFDKKYITIVPIDCDATDHDMVKVWQKNMVSKMKTSDGEEH